MKTASLVTEWNWSQIYLGVLLMKPILKPAFILTSIAFYLCDLIFTNDHCLISRGQIEALPRINFCIHIFQLEFSLVFVPVEQCSYGGKRL